MIGIDGSYGEGGGQIVRTALGLSLVTGRPFTIDNIRAKRKKPGLLRQHLTAVRAAQEIGAAKVHGAELGSAQFSFEPETIRTGSYLFQIGTAGSCTLVLQAILPALLVADGPSRLAIEGGTHNPMAPPFDFLERTFLPILAGMGPRIRARLARAGFFPAGGGRLEIEITPSRSLQTIELVDRGKVCLSARALCAQLPGHIAMRELRVVRDTLNLDSGQVTQLHSEEYGPGNVLSIFAHSAQLTETFTGFGEKNVSAEKVARRTVNQVRRYLDSGVPVGPHLADQLLIPMALAGSGRIQTMQPTSHTLTNIKIIEKFLARRFEVVQESASCWQISL